MPNCTADNQSPPVLRSAGKALKSRYTDLRSEGSAAHVHSCSSAQASHVKSHLSMVWRSCKTIRGSLHFGQGYHPVRAAPTCGTGFPLRQAVLQAVARNSHDIM
ncbi:TPA: hypothetical protein ACH3X2_005611 [Trebouxia sp. C0005]